MSQTEPGHASKRGKKPPRRLLAVGLALAGLTTAWPALADGDEPAADKRADKGCSAIGWSVKQERAWFANPKLPRRPSGARLRRIDRAVEVDLKPIPGLHFFLPPEVPPKAGSYGGLVEFFGVPHPGAYQLTLSDDSDVDVFENGARIRPSAFARAPDCPGARLSARYQLAPGDLVLVQIADAAQPTIKAAFAEAP